MSRERGDLWVARERLQRPVIVGFASLNQAGQRRLLVEAFQQRGNRVKTQLDVAPVQPRQRIEAMGFDRFDDFRLERILLGGNPEASIAHMTSGSPGNLGELGGGQPTWTAAIKLASPRKGDMV